MALSIVSKTEQHGVCNGSKGIVAVWETLVGLLYSFPVLIIFKDFCFVLQTLCTLVEKKINLVIFYFP